MADKGIIFSGPMVRALLAGQKTMTRRILKPQPGPEVTSCGRFADSQVGLKDQWAWTTGDPTDLEAMGMGADFRTGYLEGDRFYVRENWSHAGNGVWDIAAARRSGPWLVIYQADGGNKAEKWWPSIHLPREFSRLTLTVTDVKVERLQDISEEDARAEGPQPGLDDDGLPVFFVTIEKVVHIYEDFAVDAFRWIWEDIHGAESWQANPWVVAVTFTVERRNIDVAAA